MKNAANTTYIISVAAGTGCYRHIRISGAAKLADLHAAILDAFDFSDDHAHAFFMDNRMWSDKGSYYADFLEDEYGEETDRFTGRFTLNDMALVVGRQFKYVFDFGDEWVFQCKVLKELDEPCEKSVVVRSAGESPKQYPDVDELWDGSEEKDDDQVEYEEDGGEDPEVLFPEIYSRAKLNALYGKLHLPGEIVTLLHSYFSACANLYGIIPLWKVLQIYNLQNPKLSEEDFAGFAEIVRHEEQFYNVLGPDELFIETQPSKPLDRELIHESLIIIDTDEYVQTRMAQHDKPYYIPAKAALLKYAEDGYYEETPQSRAMLTYLRNEHRLAKGKSEDILSDLQLAAGMIDFNIQFVLSEMERMKIKFRDTEEINQFMSCFMNMRNNTRMASNRGYTPTELLAMRPEEARIPKAMSIGPNMTAALKRGDMDINELRREIMNMKMPNEELRISMLSELTRIQNEASGEMAVTASGKTKVGRNEPCPCGSGKKYKNCCGRN